MKRLNNRLLNSSCDESSVSKRTVSRWKKIFVDSAKKKKIDDVLSDERSVVEQKCDRINSNFEQSTIIDDHITGDDNITAVDDDINHGSVELEKKTGCPQVGFTRVSDNSIHLGQGVYVPKNSYLTAASRSKTPSQFVRKMIMAVFTPKELQDCSVHGAKSNKVKQANQKGGLDPIRLQAVKDIFSYYLKESGEFDKEKHDAQMKQFYVYVSSKITDTRAGVKRVPKVKPVENTDTEDIDSSDIEENTVASDGEEDSGQSTDEDKGERNDNSESDNTMSHQKKDEETDCDHEVETTEAVSNAAEEKLNQERSEHKDESELNNMSTQGEEKEKVTD